MFREIQQMGADDYDYVVFFSTRYSSWSKMITFLLCVDGRGAEI